MKKKDKKRIDELLVEREFASSLKEAKALLMAGEVLVDDRPITKAGTMVSVKVRMRLRHEKIPYVSRGGLKLEHALKEFSLRVKDKICMDVGASTGGFTDCLLQNGAAKVYCVDVGYGQMDTKIAKDSRVVVLDRQNILKLGKDQIALPIEIAVIDVSFISLSLVFKAIDPFLGDGASIVALIKPQFEADRQSVMEGGIVKDPEVHKACIKKVIDVAMGLNWSFIASLTSPIEGASGNKEFLALFKRP